jgi:hypothetical protein
MTSPRAFRTPAAAKERKQVGVQAVLVDMQQSMRAAFVDNELCTRNELSGRFRGDLQRDDLIIATVDYQCGDGDLPQVVAEIGLREGAKRVVGG